jgi:hypothetical protein
VRLLLRHAEILQETWFLQWNQIFDPRPRPAFPLVPPFPRGSVRRDIRPGVLIKEEYRGAEARLGGGAKRASQKG